MSKIVMFMRNESISGESKRNDTFRKKVNEIANLMLDEGFTCSEYNVNTKAGYDQVFDENKDCQLVFTTENDVESQYEACSRGIPVLEWHCFTNNKVSLVNVDKDKTDDLTSYNVRSSR